MCSAGSIVLLGGVEPYHRKCISCYVPSYVSYKIISCMLVISIAVKAPSGFFLSRHFSFVLFHSAKWSIGGFCGMAGSCTTRAMETIFSMPFLLMVAVFGCTLVMRWETVLCCVERACDVCRWPFGEHLVFWLQQVLVNYKIYIHPVCKFAFRVHEGHKLVWNAVVTFSRGRLLLLKMCVCGLLTVHGGHAVTFRHGRRMGSCRWIAGGSVLVGV